MASAGQIQSQKPGTLQVSRVQSSKALDHPPLLSQALSRKLDWKRSSWDLNQHPRQENCQDLLLSRQKLGCPRAMGTVPRHAQGDFPIVRG